MIINFRQGIISFDTAISPFTSAASVGGVDVTLNVGTQPFVITVANQSADYLHSESLTIDAWSNLSPTGTYWLYFDFNQQTFARSFGTTTLQPLVQANTPLTPATGQHWWNTTTHEMFYWNGAVWIHVLRVFACKFIANNVPANQFQSLSINAPDFRGTQVGDTTANTAAGRVVVDSSGYPIIKHDGTFFTTEDQTFTEGSAINSVRLESNVFIGQSADPSIIPVYEIVAFNPEGQVRIASYNDVGPTAVGMALQQINFSGTGAILLEGTVTNPLWNWTGLVGSLLWVSGDIPGTLQATDPHIDNPVVYQTAHVPVGRVIGPTTIMFLQGMGLKGDPGPSGSGSVPLATSATPGIVFLSTDGGAITPTATVVSEIDPRLTDARTPLPHNQAATTVTVTPAGNITSTNVQAALQELDSKKLAIAGGTMTGALILNADPIAALGAATKQYVDSVASAPGKVNRSGDTMTGFLILNADPTVALGAVTKQYVDALATSTAATFALYLPLAGGTMTGAINMGASKITNLATPTNPNDAVTKAYADNLVIPYDLSFFLAGNMTGTGVISGAYLASRPITIASGAPSSVAVCGTAPLATVVYSINQNGTQVGTITFAAASTTGVFAIGSQVNLVASDVLTIVTPGTIENNIQNVYITIVGSAVA